MHMCADHVAVILAAGGSRRLGHPKQLLARNGEPLIRHVVRTVAGTDPKALFVVVGGYRDQVTTSLQGMPCMLVNNPRWDEGLASSLKAVAPQLSSVTQGHETATLLVACDQPALHVGHLAWLLSAADVAAGRCAAARHAGGRGVPAVLPSSWFSCIDALRGDRGFGPRLRELADTRCAELHAPELQFDLDTERDVSAAIDRGWLEMPTKG